MTYYPDIECHMAPLRPCPPAPLDGCDCTVCHHYRTPVTYEPLVVRAEPFLGILIPSNLTPAERAARVKRALAQ